MKFCSSCNLLSFFKSCWLDVLNVLLLSCNRIGQLSCLGGLSYSSHTVTLFYIMYSLCFFIYLPIFQHCKPESAGNIWQYIPSFYSTYLLVYLSCTTCLLKTWGFLEKWDLLLCIINDFLHYTLCLSKLILLTGMTALMQSLSLWYSRQI